MVTSTARHTFLYVLLTIGYALLAAQPAFALAQVGRVGTDSTAHYQEQSVDLAVSGKARVVIESLGEQLREDQGFFVYTPNESGTACYLVKNDLGNEITTLEGFHRSGQTFMYWDEDASSYYTIYRDDNCAEQTANSLRVIETDEDPMPVLIKKENNGYVYSLFMDQDNWNSTAFHGQVINFFLTFPEEYNFVDDIALDVHLDGWGTRYYFRDYTPFDFPTAWIRIDDPVFSSLPETDNPYDYAYGTNFGHGWYFGHPCTGTDPSNGVCNFLEHVTLRAVSAVSTLFPIDSDRVYAHGHSMGGTGALRLGVRYPEIFASIRASNPVSNFMTTGDEGGTDWTTDVTDSWGTPAQGYPFRAVGLTKSAMATFDGTSVWDIQNLSSFLCTNDNRDTAVLTIGSRTGDNTVDFDTQALPFYETADDCHVGFQAATVEGGHTWTGSLGQGNNNFKEKYNGLSSAQYSFTNGAFPAISNASSTSIVENIIHAYNQYIEWSTTDNAFNNFDEPITDTTSTFAVSLRARIERYGFSEGPDQTISITPKRTTLFAPEPGTSLRYIVTDLQTQEVAQTGTVIVADSGRTTVDNIFVDAVGVRLTITSDPEIDDADEDGVADELDSCPNIYNPTQADLDEDDIGDACDDVDNRTFDALPDAISSYCPVFTASTEYIDERTQVYIDTDDDWIAVVEAAATNTEFLFAAGVYSLDEREVQVPANVTIRSLSGNPDDVVFRGWGYPQGQQLGFMIMGAGVQIADVTIEEMNNHGLFTTGNTSDLVVYNVVFQNIGTQFIKSNEYDNAVQDVTVACSVFRYDDDRVLGDYTAAIDIHKATNWIIRDNTVENFIGEGNRCELDCSNGIVYSAMHAAMLIWNGSQDIDVWRNVFENNERALQLGINTDEDEVRGFTVYNNVIKNDFAIDYGGIELRNVHEGVVAHNTVYTDFVEEYSASVEISLSSDITISNNLFSQGNGFRIRNDEDAPDFTTSTNIMALDPDDFVNDSLMLASSSPAIGAGIPILTITHDIEGTPRSQLAPDIGAYEFTPNADPDVPEEEEEEEEENTSPPRSGGGGGGGGGGSSYTPPKTTTELQTNTSTTSTVPVLVPQTPDNTAPIVDNTPTTSTRCPLTRKQAYKSVQSSAVYYITPACTKRPFKNPTIFYTYFTSWNDVTVVDQQTLDTIPNDTIQFMPRGDRYIPQEGAFVKSIYDPRVFVLVENRLHHFSSGEVFTALQAKGEWILDVDASVLLRYTLGPDITTTTIPTYSLFKFEADPRVFRLEPFGARWIQTGDQLKALNYHVDHIFVMDSRIYPVEILD